jgi:hypothetical protein
VREALAWKLRYNDLSSLSLKNSAEKDGPREVTPQGITEDGKEAQRQTEVDKNQCGVAI